MNALTFKTLGLFSVLCNNIVLLKKSQASHPDSGKFQGTIIWITGMYGKNFIFMSTWHSYKRYLMYLNIQSVSFWRYILTHEIWIPRPNFKLFKYPFIDTMITRGLNPSINNDYIEDLDYTYSSPLAIPGT